MSEPERPETAHHPVLAAQRARRQQSTALRLADQITEFAGSMRFVGLHVVWFAVWIGLNLFGPKFDPFPFGLLTMIVSLEAIFLSTFVMISQNRADARRQVFADNQYTMIQEEQKQNVELMGAIGAGIGLWRFTSGDWAGGIVFTLAVGGLAAWYLWSSRKVRDGRRY